MNAKDFLALVERRLVEKGMKAAAASKLAVGNPYLIRNMQKALADPDRQGARMPSFEHLQRLCHVLDSEFYVGPPRHDGSFLYDGAIDYSGAPVMTAQPAPPLPPLLRARLHLPDAATEADALAALDRLPDSAHQMLARLESLDDALKALDACRALVEQARSGDPPAAAKGPAP